MLQKTLCPRDAPNKRSPPDKAEAYNDSPMARGAVLPWLGLATADAYTVMTRKKVIMVSQPKTSPQVVPLAGPKQPGELAP